jgi:hypothetical protein
MALFDFLKRDPRKKKCARCEQHAVHGYSQAAESDVKQILPLCLDCLRIQLQQDYSEFNGWAVVIAPAAGLPCYVFRDRNYLRSIGSDIDASSPQSDICILCGSRACCSWIESKGITIEIFGEVIEKGPLNALLAWGNPPPRSLCGRCTSEHVMKALQQEGMSFFEISSPHGTQEGVVLPMAY